MFNQVEEEIRLIGIDAPEIKRSRKLLQDERETHLPGELLLQLGIQSKEFFVISRAGQQRCNNQDGEEKML